MNGLRNWEKIKCEVLGDAYDLSVAFVTDRKSTHNVLSYPLSSESGEILINKKRAKKDGYTPLELFIHGLLHLKGMRHGSRMESEEKKLIKLFTSNGPSHRRRT
ncbi:hypothetical protein IT398_00275 [Candidatus Nomurabacteria bacterium]|nr:hypothetical protein [Candidatus Nomurabacteria bacterium]